LSYARDTGYTLPAGARLLKSICTRKQKRDGQGRPRVRGVPQN